MIRNLKALGLAFVAVFAMSAVAASGAQASGHVQCGVPNPATETCEIKVTQDPQAPVQKFVVPETGTVKCPEFHAHYRGPATITESATLTGVEYKGTETEPCTFLGLEASVTFEGVAGNPCDYTLEAPLNEFEGMGRGGVTIGPEGCKVLITVPGCQLTVEGSLSFENAITYTNVTTEGREYITGHAETGNAIHVTGAGELCPGLNRTDGKYTGTFTASAFNTSGTPVNLTVVNT